MSAADVSTLAATVIWAGATVAGLVSAGLGVLDASNDIKAVLASENVDGPALLVARGARSNQAFLLAVFSIDLLVLLVSSAGRGPGVMVVAQWGLVAATVLLAVKSVRQRILKTRLLRMVAQMEREALQ